MKTVIHARLTDEDQRLLASLKRATGASDSALIRRGLRLVQKEVGKTASARSLAGRSVGRFRGGPRDLSTNPDRLDNFGR
jgi:hypothetical protein